jgi:hypothetical protein
LEPEKLTLDPGLLKLNAVMTGIAPKVSVALLLAVSTGFTFVDVTLPVPTVVALTVCEMAPACAGCPEWTPLKEPKEPAELGELGELGEAGAEAGIMPLFPTPPLHAESHIPPPMTSASPTRKSMAAAPLFVPVLV